AQELGIGVYGFAAGRDREYQPTLRGLRLEVETQPLEDVVERMHADPGRDAVRVELADVEDRREQCRHRIERALLPLEQPADRGVVASLARGDAVQQIQRLQRLTKVVAGGGEKAAFCAV